MDQMEQHDHMQVTGQRHGRALVGDAHDRHAGHSVAMFRWLEMRAVSQRETVADSEAWARRYSRDHPNAKSGFCFGVGTAISFCGQETVFLYTLVAECIFELNLG